MAEKKQLGVFWGNTSLCFVESLGLTPRKIFNIPYQIEPGQSVLSTKYLSRGVPLASVISNYLRDQNIATPSSVFLSLPTKDIIFRSFIIPWMQSNEVKSAMSFEAAKYIPFSLEELAYTYFPINIMENETRRIRIIFAAIKKITLEHFSNILEQANLTVNFVEPSPISLIRTLIASNNLPKEGTIALIEHGDEVNKIIIADQQIPQFVREFQANIPTPIKEEIVPEDVLSRLTTEVKISIDYFTRRDNTSRVDRTLLLSMGSNPQLTQKLESDLKISITHIDCRNLFKNNNIQELGFLNAYGTTLRDTITVPANFDLSQKDPAQQSSNAMPVLQIKDYKPIFITLGLCLAAIAATFFIVKSLTDKPKQEINTLTQQLGPMESVSIDKLHENSAKLTQKLNTIKSIRTENDVTYFITVIPGLLPEGTWLKSLEVNYTDPPQPKQELVPAAAPPTPETVALSIGLSGYAYSVNSTEQFGMINELLRRLKTKKDLSNMFKNIFLEVVTAERIEDTDVTYFQIKCQ